MRRRLIPLDWLMWDVLVCWGRPSRDDQSGEAMAMSFFLDSTAVGRMSEVGDTPVILLRGTPRRELQVLVHEAIHAACWLLERHCAKGREELLCKLAAYIVAEALNPKNDTPHTLDGGGG